MGDAGVPGAVWLAVGKRGNGGDALLYEVTRAIFADKLDLSFRSVQPGSYLRDGEPAPKDTVLGPGAFLSGTFSSAKFQAAVTAQWDRFEQSRFHLWTTGMNFVPTEAEIPDVRRITQRARQIYVRGTKEADFFRIADPEAKPEWAPCASLFTDKLLGLTAQPRDVVVVNFDSFLFTEENAPNHPLGRFKSFAEAQGLQVRSLINGRPDLNDYMLDLFPMIEIDRPYLEPLVSQVGSPVKFTKGYNASLEAHHSFGERHNHCRFAFGKRLHGWLPFLAFDTPSAFIGLHNRRGFPRDYFGNDDLLCNVPRSNAMSRPELETMTDMMIGKLQFFIDNEDRLRSRIAERREELWEQLQRQANSFVQVLNAG